jgi:uncharacterized cupredoxin-like copper-binding protein
MGWSWTRWAAAGLSWAILAGTLACGSPQPAAEFTVRAREFTFEPASIEIPANTPVRIVLVNQGSVEHDWKVNGLRARIHREQHAGGHGQSAAPGEVHLHATPGGRSTMELTATQPGTYEIVCTVPGHREAGMQGTLTVRVS